MNCSSKEKPNIKQIILITACVFVSMLFCCAYTSPLYPYYNNSDSAIFILIGKGMVEGKLCYVDLFDHKGPMLFFVQALGWKIGGRTGIWFLECIAMLASAFAIVGICKELKSKSFVPLLASTMVLYYTFCHGNLSEDYSLLFIYISVLLAIKYFVSEKEKHPPLYGLIYGIAFGAVAFIRVNNALVICALILGIAIDLATKKQYKNLVANLFAGVLGIVIIAAPVCLYFYLHNALYDMLYATFLYNFVYAESSSHAAILSERFLQFVVLYAPIVFALVVFIVKRKQLTKPMYMTMLIATVLSLLMLLYANVYEHYFTLAIPMFTVATAIWVKDAGLKSIFKPSKRKNKVNIALGIIVVIYIALSAYRAAAPMYKGYLTDISYDRYRQMSESAEIIPEKERNSVIGYEIPPEWYMDCDILPCYKYYIMQHWWTNSNLDVYGEYLNFIKTKHPMWIITRVEMTDKGVAQVLEEDYVMQEENDYACFYRYVGEEI